MIDMSDDDESGSPVAIGITAESSKIKLRADFISNQGDAMWRRRYRRSSRRMPLLTNGERTPGAELDIYLAQLRTTQLQTQDLPSPPLSLPFGALGFIY